MPKLIKVAGKLKLIQEEREDHEQLCRYMDTVYPKILYSSDTGSGFQMTKVQRIFTSRLRKMKGHPDLTIYEMRGGYGGLFIELKRSDVRIRKLNGEWSSETIADQAYYMECLRKAGYYCTFAQGFMDAKGRIDEYLR